MMARILSVPDRNPATQKIISVDGEGWNIPLSPGITSANPHVPGRDWHSFAMLAAADDMGFQKTLVHDGSRLEAAGDQARNYGLPTVKCLDFLLDLPEDALKVGFVFSYDSVKLLADLPLENMMELANEQNLEQYEYDRRVRALSRNYDLSIEHVHNAHLVGETSTVFDGYWIQYHPRKALHIIDLEGGRELVRNQYRDKKTGLWTIEKKARWAWKRSAKIWDVFGFFQSSFVKALKAYRCGQCEPCIASRADKAGAAAGLYHCAKALWTPEDLARIESMKAQRGIFEPGQQAEILQYCINECQYLSFLVRDLVTNIDAFGLKTYMSRYDGSGAIAAAWMKREQIKDYMPKRQPTETEGQFRLSGLPETVALSAYFGGRFEISEIGRMGTLYGYDINSAYPAVTVSLPCLDHGKFRRVREYVPGKFGVYLVGSHTSGRWAPFPFRTDKEPGINGVAKDAIYYAHGGQRWIWSNANPALSEVGKAIEHFGPDAIPVYDGYVWEPACNHKPFSQISVMYKERQEFVRQGMGIEKVIKLIINSIYGKTAQSIGWKIIKTRSGQTIKVPPVTQCFIWAGMITSGCRAKILDAIMRPGADVVSIATDGILSRTEIDLPHTPGEKILGEWDTDMVTDAYLFQSGVYTYMKKGERAYKTRGFGPKEIPAEALISAWESGEGTVKANQDESRFVSMRSGVTRNNPLEYIGQWVPSEHDVSFTHNRRLAVFTEDESGNIDYLANCQLSEPCEMPHDKESHPYQPKQCWEDVIETIMPADEDEFLEA